MDSGYIRHSFFNNLHCHKPSVKIFVFDHRTHFVDYSEWNWGFIEDQSKRLVRQHMDKWCRGMQTLPKIMVVFILPESQCSPKQVKEMESTFKSKCNDELFRGFLCYFVTRLEQLRQPDFATKLIGQARDYYSRRKEVCKKKRRQKFLPVQLNLRNLLKEALYGLIKRNDYNKALKHLEEAYNVIKCQEPMTEELRQTADIFTLLLIKIRFNCKQVDQALK